MSELMPLVNEHTNGLDSEQKYKSWPSPPGGYETSNQEILMNFHSEHELSFSIEKNSPVGC